MNTSGGINLHENTETESEGESGNKEHHLAYNPHIWHVWQELVHQVSVIKDALVKNDSVNSEYYEQNAKHTVQNSMHLMQNGKKQPTSSWNVL